MLNATTMFLWKYEFILDIVGHIFQWLGYFSLLMYFALEK